MQTKFSQNAKFFSKATEKGPKETPTVSKIRKIPVSETFLRTVPRQHSPSEVLPDIRFANLLRRYQTPESATPEPLPAQINHPAAPDVSISEGAESRSRTPGRLPAPYCAKISGLQSRVQSSQQSPQPGAVRSRLFIDHGTYGPVHRNLPPIQ